MNANTLATFCAIRELSYVEQGVANGVRGAWFQDRNRERSFYTDIEVEDFARKVQKDSSRHKQVTSFTS